MDDVSLAIVRTRNKGALLFLTAVSPADIEHLVEMTTQLDQLVMLQQTAGIDQDGGPQQHSDTSTPPGSSSAAAPPSPPGSVDDVVVLPVPPHFSQQLLSSAAEAGSQGSRRAALAGASRTDLPSSASTLSRPENAHSLLGGATVARDRRRSSFASHGSSTLERISEARSPSASALPESSTSAAATFAPPPPLGAGALPPASSATSSATSSAAPLSPSLHSSPAPPANTSTSPPRLPLSFPPSSGSPSGAVPPSDGHGARPPDGSHPADPAGRAGAAAPAAAVAEEPFAESQWVPTLYKVGCHAVFLTRLVLLLVLWTPLLGLKAVALWCCWALVHRAEAATLLRRVGRFVAVKVWWAVAVGLAHLFYAVFYVGLEMVPVWPAACWYYGVDLMTLPFVEQRIMVASGGLLGLITCIAVPLLLLHGLHMLATVTQLAGNSQFTLVKDIGVGLFAHVRRKWETAMGMVGRRRSPHVTPDPDMVLDYYVPNLRSESGAFLGPALLGLEPGTVLYLPTGAAPAADHRPPFRIRVGKSLWLSPVGVREPYMKLNTVGFFELRDGHTAEHVARFLPPSWDGGAPFTLLLRLLLPMARQALVLTFSSGTHPASAGPQYLDQSPYRGALLKFCEGGEAVRRKMLVMHAHVGSGSWLLSQRLNVSCGLSTAIPLGQRLLPTFHSTEMYCECDVDLGSGALAKALTQQACKVANHTILDLGFGLDGDGDNLAGQLLGGVRLKHLDLAHPTVLTTTAEVAPPLAAAGEAVDLFERTMSREVEMESEGRRSRRITSERQ